MAVPYERSSNQRYDRFGCVRCWNVDGLTVGLEVRRMMRPFAILLALVGFAMAFSTCEPQPELHPKIDVGYGMQAL